ncbi:aminotransferase class III-fold pyridoxal phosphate-dependent enzyme [Lipingzhangella sp. LS1_29]|uniref:Aminotransferase class III-fold pyridoxal phosphate-dependent enzyme n=1 Tax=Lipingzhangella rawalii TaxID=2055835 RepID=A0ABU2H9W4_9ACTN|nr:aminotransferase class III-fold pyridoxal phosphate-dependent enzyme [Lipingzhangella rawalii]MDS1271384.1 aminotransferase class III-fold pyridoxal phosphate-dependent enzyme [Lipingzhangella rawalii]
MNAVQAGPKFVVTEASGVWLWDDQGDRYLDGTASLWYCNVGHGRREIADAIHSQLLRLEAYTVYGDFANRPALELSERLADRAPVDDPRVMLTCGGGESIETAAKLARKYWASRGHPERVHLISRTGGYHGLHGIGTGVIGMERFRSGYGPMVEATSVVAHDSVAELEAEIHRIGPENVAAFFAEPVIGAGGVYAPPDGYFERVAELCRRHGILFISDSVICGFGRLGNWFGIERFGVRPDMIVFAKGVSSGYLPLGGVVVSGEVAAPFWDQPGNTLLHGTTYAGHPTCCAAALANMDILERENLLEVSLYVERDLDRALRGLESHPAVAEVRSGTGVMGAVQLTTEAEEAGISAPAVFREARRRGVILRAIPGAVVMSPPLIITTEQIEHLVATLRSSLDAVSERAG